MIYQLVSNLNQCNQWIIMWLFITIVVLLLTATADRKFWNNLDNTCYCVEHICVYQLASLVEYTIIQRWRRIEKKIPTIFIQLYSDQSANPKALRLPALICGVLRVLQCNTMQYSVRQQLSLNVCTRHTNP
jgi:hypothetical protein